jgi:hypothetical protein
MPCSATDKVGGIAGFFDTSNDHEMLITAKRNVPFCLAEAPRRLWGLCTRPRDLQDNAKLSARPIASVRECDGSHRPQALLRVVRAGYRPSQVVAPRAPGRGASTVPLLHDRDLVDGQPAAYVCRDFTCQAPVTIPLELEELLDVR